MPADIPYRLMFEDNPQPMWMYDLETLAFLAVNNAAVHLYGYSREEFLAMTIKDIRPLEDVPALLEAVASVDRGFTPPQGWRHRKKNGTVIQVEITSHTIDYDGHPAELVMARDLTAHLHAEARVRHLNRVYAVLSDINQTIVREKDTHTLLVDACRVAVDKGGFLMAWIGITTPGTGALAIAAHAGADTGTIAFLQGLIDADPPAGCVFTQAALDTGVFRVCNQIDRDPEASHWRAPALARGYESMAAFPLRTGKDVIGVFTLYAAEPNFFIHDEVTLLDELAQDISFALEVARRETERVAADTRSARQREALIALTAQHSPLDNGLAQELRQILEVTAETLGVARVSVWRYSTDRTAINCLNLFDTATARHSTGAVLEARTYPGYFAALAREEVIAADDAVMDPRTREFADTYLRPIGIGAMLDVPTTVGSVRDGVVCHEHVGGPRRWTEDEKTFAVAIGNLVSLNLERKVRRELERQFRQAQKMEAIGQLAGGVAHDFNNILTAIQFNAALLQSADTQPDEAAECARDIETAVQRAAGLTRQLLTFSRKQVMQARHLDLNTVVTELASMLRRIIGEDVMLDVRCTTEALPVHADPGMMEQVLMNLAVNARDAMPSGGTVIIETTTTVVEGVPHARLSVTDTGTGMSPAVQARVFEPFFTTKAAGSGTGLGLAMVHGIVEQHHGRIEIDTVEGQGTTFSVFVPCLQSAMPDDTAAPSLEPTRPPGPGGQVILVVEDEASVRQLIRTILVRAGYHVVVAEHGVAALAEWAVHKDTIALVLTDIVMPGGMTGADLARAIREDGGTCPIVFTSGYAPEAVTQQVELTEGVNFLPKPLSVARLLSVVALALGSHHEP